MRRRNLTSRLLAALADTPALFLQGPRQAGKSTLVRLLQQQGHRATYLTLDDAAVLAAAEQDTAGFIDGLSGPVILDEVQRVPALFTAIKKAVDEERTPGRFLLTGSANALVLPQMAESLVGRVEILTLMPFSQGEVEGRRETFIDALFSQALPQTSAGELAWPDLIDRMLTGGYPEAVERRQPDRRRAWFGSYVTTILQRDVRDMASVERLSAFPQLLRLLAARCASLLNLADLSRAISVPHTSLKRYLALLEAAFLVQLIPAWSSNLGKRLVKSPKIMLCDSGLLGSLLGLDADRLMRDATIAGHVLENFVAMELLKQATWSDVQPTLHHFRSHARHEVDLLLEDAAGRVVGIEVKSSVSVAAEDFRGLRHLSETLGEKFVRGILLYRGANSLPFGPNLRAVPINALWE